MSSMHDSRLSFNDENEINGLWELVNGDIDPSEFKSQYPAVYNQIKSQVGTGSGPTPT